LFAFVSACTSKSVLGKGLLYPSGFKIIRDDTQHSTKLLLHVHFESVWKADETALTGSDVD
jgi:hypothetical protein